MNQEAFKASFFIARMVVFKGLPGNAPEFRRIAWRDFAQQGIPPEKGQSALWLRDHDGFVEKRSDPPEPLFPA